jgi:3'-phosphoadenosine 5'-phosphosulfate sulfotransferase (PAPS reductase)/FAD synthetase
MSTHTADMLKLLQQLPLEIKIEKSKQRIIEWYEHYQGNVYISFSGGKDSTVLLHLAREIYKDIEAVFVDTGLEYNQIRDFVKTFDNVTWVKPKMRFDEVIAKYGYPIISKEQSQYISQYRLAKSQKTKDTRLNGNKYGRGKISESHKYLLNAPFLISDNCCNIMKKTPVKIYEKKSGKKPIIGTMAEESEQRKSNWIINGCNSFNTKRPTSKPLSFWTEQDILQYLLIYKIPYCSIYGDIGQDDTGKLKTTGQQRTGCVFCGYGAHLEKLPNRYEKLKEIDFKKWDYCMRDVKDNGLGFGKVLDFINVKWGKDDPNDFKLDGF